MKIIFFQICLIGITIIGIFGCELKKTQKIIFFNTFLIQNSIKSFFKNHRYFTNFKIFQSIENRYDSCNFAKFYPEQKKSTLLQTLLQTSIHNYSNPKTAIIQNITTTKLVIFKTIKHVHMVSGYKLCVL